MKWIRNKIDKKQHDDSFESVFSTRRLLCTNGLIWDPNLSLRKKLRLILRSNIFHIIIIILVVLDVISVAIELTIAIEKGKTNQDGMTPVEAIFKYISLSILSLFMIEIILKIFILRKEMIKSKTELFDAIVVIVSFILDIVFLLHTDTAAIPVEFLAILRLWRIIRVVNSNNT